MSNFEVKDGVATYIGPINGEDIAWALGQTKELAATQDITAFRVEIPNADWNVVEDLFRIAGRKHFRMFEGVGQQRSVILKYAIQRTLTVSGVDQSSVAVPDEPMDLTNRRVI